MPEPYSDYDADFDDLFSDDVDDARCICDGSGTRVTCIDDVCRGLGECIHGDGEMECPIHGI